MNTQTQEALKMLDAIQIKYSDLIYNEAGFEKAEEFEDDIIAVKEAIATNEESSVVQPAQEPVSWNEETFNHIAYAYRTCPVHEVKMVNERYQELVDYVLSITHSTPDSTLDSTPAHQWQGLTDDEVDDFMFQSCDAENGYSITDLIRLVEQTLKEKNHG